MPSLTRPERVADPTYQRAVIRPVCDPETDGTAAAEPIGRAELLRQAREQLCQGPGLLLTGPAGIGKSLLLASLVTGPVAGRAVLLRCAPAEAELPLPFVCLIDLLGPVPDQVVERLPASLRTALRAALLRGDYPRGNQDHLEVRVAVLRLLRELAVTAPVWLVVDDLQWVDQPTAEILDFVARRLAELPGVRLLAAARTPDGDAVACAGQLRLRAAGIPELAVPPLAAAGLDRMIRRQTGLPLSPRTVHQIHRVTGGNPFYALEVARALPPDHAALAPAESLPIPLGLRDLLLRRLRDLPAPTRSVLLLASAAARPTLTVLRAAAAAAAVAAAAAGADDAGPNLTTAERLGVIRVAPDGQVRFEHPLVRAAIYADATSQARRAAHCHLAAAVTEPVERARHLALAHPHENEQVAGTLMAAAASARRRGAPASAAELATLAAERTPGQDPDRRTRRLLAAADYSCDAGLRDDARRVAAAVLAGSESARHRIPARLVLLRCAGQAMTSAGPLIADGLAEAAGDEALAAPLWCWSATRELAAGRLVQAAAQAGKAAELASRVGDVATQVAALTRLAHVQSLAGQPEGEAVLRRALDAAERAGRPAVDSWEPRRRQAMFDLYANRLGVAEHRLVALVDGVGEAVGVEGLAAMLVTLTEVRVRAGACQAALDSAHRAVRAFEDVGCSCGPALFAAALAEGAGGSPVASREFAEAGIRASRVDGDQYFLLCNLTVLGRAHLLADEPVRAAEVLREAHAIEDAIGIADPAVGFWHADLAEALVACGALDEAAQLVASVGTQARLLDRPGVAAALTRAEALRQVALGKVADGAEALVSAAQRQHHLSLPLEEVRTLVALAGLERRRRRVRAARAALTEAYDLCVRAGARPWIARVGADLRRMSEPVDSGGTIGALTPAEWRCAELAGTGATNREIAAALFLSVKTVEATLSRIYRKLSVRSRTELARTVARHAPRVQGIPRY